MGIQDELLFSINSIDNTTVVVGAVSYQWVKVLRFKMFKLPHIRTRIFFKWERRMRISSNRRGYKINSEYSVSCSQAPIKQ